MSYSVKENPLVLPLIGESDELEVDVIDQETGEITDLNRLARNLFRYIVRGTEVNGSSNEIKQGLKLVEHALTKQCNPKLTSALREEFQTILDTIGTRLINVENLTPELEQRYEILISNLLAAYTFLDPHQDETKLLYVPQKIGNRDWQIVQYRVEPLDLSPQKGLISKLIRDEDRIYAYGLTPVESDSPAHRQLLLMGTTYPTGQGAKFSNLHKFDPGYSVGENYDWQSVDAWIKSQGTKVKTTGHSQGGSSAMFIAATYPEYISQADCLNPPALCTSTLNRLNPKWLDIPENDRPCVNVYAQEGDIVYQLENGFLSGTKIFQISSDVDKCSNLNPLLPQFFQKILESHLHHFVGRERSTITQLDAKQESFTHKREFFGDMKAATNWVLFPFFYSDLVMGFALRNTSHWCLEHLPKALTLPIAIVGFIPYHALKYALNLSLLLVKTCLLVSTLLLTAFISGMKIGMCSAFGISYSPEDNKNINPSPVAVSM